MRHEYLDQLGGSVQKLVREVERLAGVEIEVLPSIKQNDRGPTRQGALEIVINAQNIQLFAPTNGYFPDGAVRHEILHVQRFHIEGVPKLALADDEEWDRGLSDAMGALDNAIEHVVIVPVELQFHPERREHWEAVMKNVCSGLPDVPESELRLAVCLHWTFLRHVLPDSPQLEIAKHFATEHGLLEMADHFADQFLSAADSKEEMVRVLFQTFPEIPKGRVAFEYINSVTGTRQVPIP
jgi:hypothetical protein